MQDYEAAAKNAGVQSIFHFGTAQAVPVIGDGDTAAADAGLGLWKTLLNFANAQHLIARTATQTMVISAHGATLVQASTKLNAALLLRDLTDLDSLETSPSAVPDMQFDDVAYGCRIALAQRIAGVEAPRAFCVRVGTQEIDLYVTKSGFHIDDDARGLQRMIDAIHGEDAELMAYRLNPLPDVAPEPTLTIADIFNGTGQPATDNATWCFSAEGWPLLCPEAAGFDLIAALSATAKALADWCKESAAAIQLLDAQKKLILSAKSDSNGQWHLSTAASTSALLLYGAEPALV